MITAVDTNVLLDVFGADPLFGENSRESLRNCLAQGQLIACEVVWAEVAASFPTKKQAVEAMERLGVVFSPLDASSALSAGVAWKDYRSRGGRRRRIVPDFLIGAHAASNAERLLTRDRGFYREYSRGLSIIDPSGN